MGDLTNISVVKRLLEKNGFTFSKSLGQNFIIDPAVCPKIAQMGSADKEHGMIEIGTGVGVLTAELAKRAKKVVAIEIDTRLKPVLEETLSEYDNVEIIFADVMKLDLKKLINDKFAGMKVAVCANLPYYITSPIIMKLLEQRLPIESVTVMVQKEAADRLCAPIPSREVGAVTIAVNYFSRPKVLFGVSRGCFMPSPKVDSSVIRLDMITETPYKAEDEELFFKAVRGAFSQRRKTLANSVAASMNIEKSKVIEAISDVGLPDTVRPENLTVEQFIMLSDRLGKMVSLSPTQ